MTKIIGIAAVARSGKDTVASMLLKHERVATYALADPLKLGCQILFGLTDAETWHDDLKEKVIPHWGWSPRKFFQTVGTDWLRDLNSDHWLLRANLAFKQHKTDKSDKSQVDFTDPTAPFKLATQVIFGITQDEAWNPLLINNKNEYWDMTPNEMINFLYNHTYKEFQYYDFLRSERPLTFCSKEMPVYGNNNVVIIKDIRFENEADFIRSHNGSIWHVKRDNATKVINHSSERGIGVKPGDIIINNNGSLTELEVAVEKEWDAFLK